MEDRRDCESEREVGEGKDLLISEGSLAILFKGPSDCIFLSVMGWNAMSVVTAIIKLGSPCNHTLGKPPELKLLCQIVNGVFVVVTFCS